MNHKKGSGHELDALMDFTHGPHLPLKFVVAATIFAVDLIIPLGVATGVPYVVLVFIGLWSPSTRDVYKGAIVGSVLTVLGFFLSSSGSVLWMVLANRCLALGVIWVTALLCLKYRQSKDKLLAYATTLTESQQQLETACKAAQVADKAKSEFLANISHELRTPLHGILSFARFGIDEHETAERLELFDYFKKVDDSGQSLLRLINDLLDLAKLEAGKMTLDLESYSLGLLVSTVADEFCSLCSERNLSIRCTEQDLSGEVMLDQEGIKQVIRNLLSNAVKFSPEGGSIFVDACPSGGGMRVSVRDEGPGIPEGEEEAVFDKFVQSSRTKSGSGGTGLGLAICREILTAHQGRIWAENHADGGAVFVFDLPNMPVVDDTEPDESLLEPVGWP